PEPETTPPALGVQSRPVVYGEDNRLDVYAHPSAAWRDLARQSIAVMAFNSDLDLRDPNNVRINGSTLGDAWRLCSGQRFMDQPTGGQCSATLIDEDLVLTAGHCIDSGDCSQRSFLFDYYYEAPGQLANISAADVYGCQEVVAHALDGSLDYAVVRLDRPVGPERRPVPVSAEAVARVDNSPVTLIGFPTGIPLKIASGGRVVDPRAGSLDYFQATVDAFGGNSGSGVFDDQGQLVGILVRGATDYVPSGSCYIVNVLSENTNSGEDITYGFRAHAAVCDRDPNAAPFLCSGGQGGEDCFACVADEDCAEGFTCEADALNPQIKSCAGACTRDSDCAASHECLAGRCAPRHSLTCEGADVIEVDACGQRLAVVQTCGAQEECRAGACVPRGAGEICATALPLEVQDGLIYRGSLTGATNDSRGACAGAGPEHVFRFSLDAPAFFSATASGFDTVLYLRAACEDPETELLCNDDSTPPGDLGSYIEGMLEAGTYALFMDAYGMTVGDYTLSFTLEAQCVDACEVGARRCLDNHTDERCVIGADGCAAWAAVDCGRQICASGYGCVARAAGDRCAEATLIPAEAASYEGDLGMYTATMGGSCGGLANDRFYAFELSEARTVAVEAKGMDTIVYLIGDCAAARQTEAGCNDDHTPPGAGGSYLESTLEPGRYILVIDSNTPEAAGAYQLDVDFLDACLVEPCAAGEVRCVDGGVETCVARAAGCTYWAAPHPCEAGFICEGGACVCDDECADEGSAQCLQDSVITCEADPETGCLSWSAPLACVPPMICEEGACVLGCQPACALGEARCEGAAVARCEAIEGCPAWGAAAPCGEGLVCEDGACVDACQPECTPGAVRCAAGGVQACEGACGAWSDAIQPCPAGCAEGACLPVIEPDATVIEPDATVIEPDATVIEPDATVVEPDATVIEPDATVIEPDATVVEPDATVIEPDAT
ncbi:serine protease, partial [Myxococcota bacterium]|nr:serine protease [Myxococcota bacterium]